MLSGLIKLLNFNSLSHSMVSIYFCLLHLKGWYVLTSFVLAAAKTVATFLFFLLAESVSVELTLLAF